MQQRTTVVTGASSGIGEALSETLGARGDHVILVARSTGRLEELAQRIAMRMSRVVSKHVAWAAGRSAPAAVDAHTDARRSPPGARGRCPGRKNTGVAIALLCALRAASAADDGRIEAKVSGVADGPGLIGCALFASPAGFPLETRQALATVRAMPAGGTATCVFEAVAAGDYAVAAVHDANDNELVDTNFLGVPIEGVGVSNNALPRMSMPRFDACRFTVAAGETRNLSIAMRY